MAIVDDLGRVDNPIDRHWAYNRRVINANGDLTPYQMYVQNFGVVGDGVTDNTTNLQTAIDAACAVNGALIFPYGKYVTGPLTVGATGNYGSCSLVGERMDAQYANASRTTTNGTILSLKAQGNGHLINVPPANASDVGPGPPLIKDLWLDGNSSAQTGSYWLIDLPSHSATGNKARSIFLDRVRGSNAGGGLRVGNLRNAGFMKGCAFLNTTASAAVQLNSNSDWRFIDNDLWANSGLPSFYSPGGGSVIFTATNFFSTTSTHGVKIDAAAGDHTFYGCSFDRNARSGIYIIGDATTQDPVMLIGCRFTLNSTLSSGTYSDIICDTNKRVGVIGCTFEKGTTSRSKHCIETLNGASNIIAVGNFLKQDSGGLQPYGTSFTNDTGSVIQIGDELTAKNFWIDYDANAVNRVRVKGGTAFNPAIVGANGDADAGLSLYADRKSVV